MFFKEKTMRKLKKVLGVVIAFVMMFSMASFRGVEAKAKEIPKYLKDDTEFIYQAYIYGDRAIALTNSSGVYLDKKVKNFYLSNELYPMRVSKKYVYCTNFKEEFFMNLEDGGKTDALPTLLKMNKAVEDKYNVDLKFSIHDFEESDTDLLWARFYLTKDGENVFGVVSSNGDVIEIPIEYEEIFEIVMHKDKAYILHKIQDKYNIEVYSPNSEKVNLCEIDEIFDKQVLAGLVFNNNEEIYITYKGQLGLEKGENEISKVNVKDGKGILSTIAKYKYDYKYQNTQRSLLSVDNNKNIWYLQDGLIYKIENDKPILKYEVQKNRSDLFVGDDNNLIVSVCHDNDTPGNKGKSTIINLSDKYEQGWVKDFYSWNYYKDRQAVNNQWELIDGKWYYFGIYGEMTTGWMKSDDGKMYYLGENGQAAIGWEEIYGEWYYFDNSAAMVSGWINLNGKWYYLNKTDSYPGLTGVMVKGWIDLEGKWYYLNDDGSMVTGWKKVNGSWYYFYNNGVMAHDTIIDGYKIGSNGAMI